MSLSTLLEAAKYLDYLDSNNQQQQNQQLQFQPRKHNTTTSSKTKSTRRRSKKDAANTMVAMSLPASAGRSMPMHGVPIPFASSSDSHQASLSSSFTTGSPLSSFASTALLCSKASGVTSASSSAASSLSSSDSSSSCGEILMGDNDFNTSLASSNNLNRSSSKNNDRQAYDLTHQNFETNHQVANQNQYNVNADNNNCQSVARYIAATSSGPQLVTMTATSSLSSASAPIDGRIRAGHVIHAANGAMVGTTTTGTSFDSRHFSIAANSLNHQQQAINCSDGQALGLKSSSMAAQNAWSTKQGDNQLSSSPNSCPPLIMARVQPIILNSLSPSAQSIMAFQPATASSPTSSSSSYSRHRELHKTLEKNRRAHLRHCFEILKAELPASECVDKKTSHINIIKSAIRYVLALRQQECEIDNELQRLIRIKTELTEKLSSVRNDQNQDQQNQQQPLCNAMSPPADESHQQLAHQPTQQPVAEQQLSFLLSQSKID